MTGEVDRQTRELLLVVLMAFSRRDVPFLTDTLLILSGDDRRGDVDIRGLQADLAVIVNRMAGATISSCVRSLRKRVDSDSTRSMKVIAPPPV